MKYLNSKKLLSVFLIAGMSVSMISGCGSSNKLTETEISKSPVSNPIVGNSSTGDFLYGGDPSVLVDGDTVYLYTGHDASSDAEVNKAIYNIPEYLCYSSKDLINWNYEGSVMNMKDVSWGDKTSAWASQVAKHTDPETGKDKYYLYFCSWDKTSNGRQSIGVAVSDSPTGPFVDIGEPLVSGNVTKTNSSNWEDIDPTVWIDTDDEGVEHRYLAWGNACFFICELNEDMISVKDITGNHEITYGTDPVYDDIINKQSNLGSYTEAPWLYRKSDGNGGYTGDYYLFYASGWREGMSYATTDDLIYGKWMFGDAFMTPNATSNTNHMAVFDFQGETYMVYHDGALPGGNGYRRSACIAKLEFEDDGSVKMFEESTAAIGGTVSTIQTLNDEPISHVSFNNPASDTLYPFKGIVLGINEEIGEKDSQWVIVQGKFDSENVSYVSIESENKTGLFWTSGIDNDVTLSQDTAANSESSKAQTFKTLTDKDGNIIFESLLYPETYVSLSSDNTLKLTATLDDTCKFKIN